MNYCQRCNGIGYTSLQGDNETLCLECDGSGIAHKRIVLKRLSQNSSYHDFNEYDDQWRDGRNPDDREWYLRVQDTY